MNDHKKIWLTWERQRRSVVLSESFGATLHIIEKFGILRKIKCMLTSFKVVRQKKPDILFVQNPSMLLAVVSCLLKKIFPMVLVIDRHSNFQLHKEKRSYFKRFMFNSLNHFTLVFADITIITNLPLYHSVKISGGAPFILPDKLPDLNDSFVSNYKFKNYKSLLIISSFGLDEPFDKILPAIDNLAADMPDLKVYISGNCNKLAPELLNNKPSAVEFTGFLPDDEFDSLLKSVDAVMVLTTIEYVLLCGCYEAIAAGKPLITSNTSVLKDLFTNAIFVDPSPESIAGGIIKCFKNLEHYELATIDFRSAYKNEWNSEFYKLNTLIDEFASKK